MENSRQKLNGDRGCIILNGSISWVEKSGAIYDLQTLHYTIGRVCSVGVFYIVSLKKWYKSLPNKKLLRQERRESLANNQRIQSHNYKVICKEDIFKNDWSHFVFYKHVVHFALGFSQQLSLCTNFQHSVGRKWSCFWTVCQPYTR